MIYDANKVLLLSELISAKTHFRCIQVDSEPNVFVVWNNAINSSSSSLLSNTPCQVCIERGEIPYEQLITGDQQTSNKFYVPVCLHRTQNPQSYADIQMDVIYWDVEFSIEGQFPDQNAANFVMYLVAAEYPITTTAQVVTKSLSLSSNNFTWGNSARYPVRISSVGSISPTGDAITTIWTTTYNDGNTIREIYEM